MATVDPESRSTPPADQRVTNVPPEDTIPALPVPLVIGVTGHRDLVTGELPLLEERVRAFFEELHQRYPGQPLEVMSPLAEGADRLVARVALDLGLRLIAPLPMHRDEYLEDFAELASRDEFENLVAQAIDFPVPDWSWKEPRSAEVSTRDLQYAQLGVFIASHCHILLALWDGLESSQTGGTAQVIEFHQRDYMPGLSEQRAGLSLNLVNDESDLVYHITCSRIQHGHQPAGVAGGPPEMAGGPTGVAGEVSWFTADEVNPRTTELPERYDLVFTRIAEFNADARLHLETIEREGWALSSSADSIPRGARRIEQAFKVADWLALRFQRRIDGYWRAMLGIGITAGLCFVAFADLPGQELMIYPYLGLLTAGIALFFVAQKGGWHRRHLDYRVLAESLRVQFYWTVAGVSSPTPTQYNHDSYLSKQDIELGWIRHVLRFTGRRATALLDAPTSAGISFAIERWVGGQRDFFGRRVPEKIAAHKRNALIGKFCFWTGIVIAVILALVQYALSETWKAPMMAMMGLLPLIAGFREFYSHKKADMELIKQFSFMHRIMKEALRRLHSTESDDDRREILRALGETALDEQAEWIMRQRERHPDSQEVG